MLSDLRYTFRQLRKSPGFTLIAMGTLALGIGGSTIFFGALRALVLDPLPYPEADRLVQLWSGQDWPLSTPDYFDIADASTSFAELGAYSPQTANLGGERPQSVPAVACTPGVLRAFGIGPLYGRLLEPADEQPGAAPVAVIGHALWCSAFNSDPAIVGRTARLNGDTVTIVGVMPAHFEFAAPWMRGTDCQLWKPLQIQPGTGERGSHWICGLARLKPGVTFGAATAEVQAIGKRLTAAYPATNTSKKFLVHTLHAEMTRYVENETWLLFGAVLLVLLIACSNVASMLLAHGALQQSELGLRSAIGATRIQLCRLVLCKSLLIALAGSILGFGLAVFLAEPVTTFITVGDLRKAAIAPDLGALGFAVALAFLSTLLAGVPAALAGTRTDVATALHSCGRSATGSATRHRLLYTLVVAQIVVAFMLANGAALFATSYLRLKGANADLATDRVLAIELNLRGARYADDAARARFCDRLVEAAQALPGVSAAGTTSKLPLEGGMNLNILVRDQTFDPAESGRPIEVSAISPTYFESAGIRLLRGRTLKPEDSGTAPLGIVVNRTLAEYAWPGQDPIGQLVRPSRATPDWTATVVGVVEDVRQWGPTKDPQPEIYWNSDRAWHNTVFLLVRSPQSAAQLAAPLRQVIASLDPDLPLTRVRTLEQLVLDTTGSQRLVAWLIGIFMGLALLLLATGLFGTLSYLIRQRTREIGIRLALGAAPAGISRLVIGQGLRWVLVGAVLGAAGSLALASLLRSMLWGTAPFDPTALASGLVAIVVVGLLACWLPARRATRVDPIEALRAD